MEKSPKYYGATSRSHLERGESTTRCGPGQAGLGGVVFEAARVHIRLPDSGASAERSGASRAHCPLPTARAVVFFLPFF